MNKFEREQWEKMTPKERDWLSILTHVMPEDWDAAVARHNATFPPESVPQRGSQTDLGVGGRNP